MKPILETFKGKRLSPPPIWLMRQAGRYLPEYQKIRATQADFLKMCYNPEIACEVTLQPIRRFGFDAAIIFSDILVIPDALGQKVSFKPDHGPVLRSIEKIKEVPEGLEPIYEALKLVKKEIPDTCTLLGFAGTPWTLATYMIEEGKTADFKRCFHWIQNQPEKLAVLINMLTKQVASHLIKQIEAGADAVQIFDTWGNVVPKEHVETLIIQPFQSIVHQIRQTYPDVPVVYYSRGMCNYYSDITKGLSHVVLGVDHLTPLSQIRQALPIKTSVQGALCPEILLKGGQPLKEKTKEILTCFSSHPLVFNLGHGILPQTPIDHVHQLIDLVRTSQ